MIEEKTKPRSQRPVTNHRERGSVLWSLNRERKHTLNGKREWEQKRKQLGIVRIRKNKNENKEHENKERMKYYLDENEDTWFASHFRAKGEAICWVSEWRTAQDCKMIYFASNNYIWCQGLVNISKDILLKLTWFIICWQNLCFR